MLARLSRSGPAIAILWVVGLVVLAVSVSGAITIGPSSLTTPDVYSVIASHVTGEPSGLSRIQDGIVWNLRLPRSLMAALCGAGLAICGVILQSLLRNPLADPYLLGIASGASTGAVAVVVLGLGAGVIGLTGGAFLGSLVAFGLVILLASVSGGTVDRVILAGVAATQLFSALTSFIVYVAADAESTRGVLFWLLGSLSSIQWSHVSTASVAVLIGLVICLGYANHLDAFTFGNNAAAGLGINIARTRAILITVTAIITAVIVSSAGAISFVGLVLPHAARALVGVKHRILLPTSALMGAIFLVWIDAFSRTVLAPQELPIGIATALVGVPAFVILLMRKGKQR